MQHERCDDEFYLIYFISQSLYFERTLWRLFQKRAVGTKLDIYVFIFIYGIELKKDHYVCLIIWSQNECV
jgi:hypothetical protein